MKTVVMVGTLSRIAFAGSAAEAQSARSVQRCYKRCREENDPCAGKAGCASPAYSYDCDDPKDYSRFRGYCDSEKGYAQCAGRCREKARQVRARQAQRRKKTRGKLEERLRRAKQRLRQKMERFRKAEQRREGFDERVKKGVKRGKGGMCPWWRNMAACKQRCQDGDAAVCAQVGMAHYTSSLDKNDAAAWGERGCDLGNAFSCHVAREGHIYQNRRGYGPERRAAARGIAYGLPQCKKGNALSCWVVGHMYRTGLAYSDADKRRAFAYFEKACDLGSWRGCGRLLYYGDKVTAGDLYRPVEESAVVRKYFKALEASCAKDDWYACVWLLNHDYGKQERIPYSRHDVPVPGRNPQRRRKVLRRICASGFPFKFTVTGDGGYLKTYTRRELCRGHGSTRR